MTVPSSQQTPLIAQNDWSWPSTIVGTFFAVKSGGRLV